LRYSLNRSIEDWIAFVYSVAASLVEAVYWDFLVTEGLTINAASDALGAVHHTQVGVGGHTRVA